MIADYKPSEWVEKTEKELVFDDGYGNGFCFPCTLEGEPMLTDCNRPNYEFALSHPEKFERYNKVIERKWRYKENAKGTCGCGEKIELYDEYMGACQCPKCGQWYNLFGQRLNPPEQWEEPIDYDY